MCPENCKFILKNKLKFSDESINDLVTFKDILLNYNKKYNLISKSSEKQIWDRHIIDSAQILSHFDHNLTNKIVDFGSGAGFPGLILAIFDKNRKFHVKLYEKSVVKRNFLSSISQKLDLDISISENVYDEKIETDLVVCRAFKKLPEILKISREIIKKPHKIIILKGKDAQSEINKVSLGENYSYKLENSITNNDSKIIIFNVKKYGK